MLAYSKKRAIQELTVGESEGPKSEDTKPRKKARLVKVKTEAGEEGRWDISASVTPKSNLNYKTVPCKNFSLTGSCQYGLRCTFKHGLSDIGETQMPASATSNYKIVLCQRWSKDGWCSFADRCTFMHGASDYKGGSATNTYKNVTCQFLSTNGFGKRGARPGFINGSVLKNGNLNAAFSGGNLKLRQMNTAISPKAQGFLDGEPNQIRPRDFSANPFAGTSHFLGTRGNRGLPSDAIIFPGKIGGANDQLMSGSKLPPNYKTVACKNFSEEGTCRFGSRCTFKHGDEKISTPRLGNRPNDFRGKSFVRPAQIFGPGAVRGLPSNALQSQGMAGGARNNLMSRPNLPPNYKTVACKNLSLEGVCRFGSLCTFKHGDEKIDIPRLGERQIEFRPRTPLSLKNGQEYKSVPCMALVQTGFCQYGAECWFIHGNEDRRLSSSLHKAAFPLPEPGKLGGFMFQPNSGSGDGGSRSNYKTVMCNHWAKDGKCPYAEKCTFKHGDEKIGYSK